MFKKDDPGRKNDNQGQNIENEQNRNQNGQAQETAGEQAHDQAQNQGRAKNQLRFGKAQNQGQEHDHKKGRNYRNNGYGRNQPQSFGQKKQIQQADSVASAKDSRKGGFRNRDSQARTGNAANAIYNRHDSSRAKIEDTIENIREDILRIEKEIELEIKEIRGLKL